MLKIFQTVSLERLSGNSVGEASTRLEVARLRLENTASSPLYAGLYSLGLVPVGTFQTVSLGTRVNRHPSVRKGSIHGIMGAS